MSRSRLLTVIVGIVLVLGLMAWLVDTAYRLYVSASLISPLLGTLLLIIFIVLLIALLAASLYYVWLFRKPKQRRVLPQVPVQKAEAAKESIAAVRLQVAQIQDEILRQVLLERSQELETSFQRRELKIIVFGTGSAGKTSLVNAIMGRMVGRVGAPMGTTDLSQSYRLQLRGLERDIEIIDTPGILESGIAGTDREQSARRLASEADLLLFVIDNDLRQSEYSTLRSLADIGKRIILVFNKIDLYLEEDVAGILDQLGDRLRDIISADDMVAITANPQLIQLESGETVRPEPEIVPLLRRIATVLRTEGEDLIADNILLQTLRIGEEARQLIDAERRRQAEVVVDRFQWIGAGVVSVMPLPGIDLLAAAAINAQMVVEIGRIYGCELNLDRGKELAISLAKTLVSLGVVRGAIELFTIALQTNVGTFLIGRAVQGVTAAYLTRIAGKSFIEYFRRDQDWGDGGITQVVQEQFQLNRRDEFMKAFMKEAIARIVQPITERNQADGRSGERR